LAGVLQARLMAALRRSFMRGVLAIIVLGSKVAVPEQ